MTIDHSWREEVDKLDVFARRIDPKALYKIVKVIHIFFRIAQEDKIPQGGSMKQKGISSKQEIKGVISQKTIGANQPPAKLVS